ncbi:MAG: hypothetical protein PVF58_14600 [Candidatus Methanofastidiosia archaeon]|jgi:hypothetical protein
MKICLRPKNKEIAKKVDAIPSGLYFYPVNAVNNVMIGLGIFSDCSFDDSIKILRGNLFQLVKFVCDNAFIFQSRYLTDLKPVKNDFIKSFFIEENSVCFIDNSRPKNVKKEFEKDKWELSFSEKESNFVDKYTSDLNPLLQLIRISSKMKEREIVCFSLAVNAGFPYENIIDFEKNKINQDNILLKEWEDAISSQRGEIEKDFVRTLRRSINIFTREYHDLLQEIESIVHENNDIHINSSIDSLKILINEEKLPGKVISKPRLPLFKIKGLKITGIFHILEEDKESFMEKLQSVLTSDFGSVKIEKESPYEIDEKPDKRKRIAIDFLIDFSKEPIRVDEILDKLELFRFLVIEESLKEIDSKSYERYKRLRKKQLWITGAQFSLIVPLQMKEEIKELIHRKFKNVLSYKHGIKEQTINKKDIALIFETWYEPYLDFELSENMDFFFAENDAPDEFTRIAVENIFRGEFDVGRRYLERGKWAIHGDILIKKVKRHPLEEETLTEVSKAYKKAGITFDKTLDSPAYMKGSSERRLHFAQTVNRDWGISLDLVLAAVDLRKEIEKSIDLDKEIYEKKIKEIRLLKKYSGVQSRRNAIDFVENIEMFYSSVLQEAERKFGDFTRYWIGFDF